MTWLFLALIVIALVWAISAYNKLIALKGNTINAWKQIDVQLKRRHDLIPNLVEAVKGAMEFERETLEAVIQARNQAVKIQADAMPTGGVQQLAAAEAALSSALGRLNVVVERYPDLKATSNVAQLQEELTSTENRVSFARQLYNDTATTYNVKQQQFPWNMIAGFAKAEPVELWEITDEQEREVPKVDLSMKPKE
ncbi:MAG: LemA family protein [Gemmatimonadota bacterium]|nr:MAG: LemA family protein [Gemmatimonadota bacterium]